MNRWMNSNEGGKRAPFGLPFREGFSVVDKLVDVDRNRLSSVNAHKEVKVDRARIREYVSSVLTTNGAGFDDTVSCYLEWIHPHFRRVNDPGYLSWVPAAPSDAATLGDLLVTLDNAYSGSVADAEGPVAAEQAALSVVSRLARFPATAQGTFVSGGTAGNIAALMVARENWRSYSSSKPIGRGIILCSEAVHSSVLLAASVLDCEVMALSVDDCDRIDIPNMRDAIDDMSTEIRSRLCAVVGTAGTTNAGVIDDLQGLAAIAREVGIWFHVDAAYGGAALFGSRAKSALLGLAEADSFIVDPHKWLFSPYDSCAVLYREPHRLSGVFHQEADYLSGNSSASDWDPADLAPQLSRRARGLPFWWTLAVYGSDKVGQAVDESIDLIHWAASRVRDSQTLELLVEPELSVMLFARRGWTHSQYVSWSKNWEEQGRGLVVTTWWRGEPALRLCVVNPETTRDTINSVLSSVESAPI